MKDHPLVSIISPVYNHEKYITACIKSVRSQTFPDWEMIIINDGSTDNTVKVIEPFLQLDDRIHLLDQENIGIFKLSDTYNRGLHVAKGKYIAILEGDDFWEPDKLERQVAKMKSDQRIILAWGLAQTYNESSGVPGPLLPLTIQQEVFNNDPPGLILKSLFFENPIPAVTMLFRRDILIDSGGFQQSFNLPLVDLPTIFNIVQKGKFYFDPHLLADWRISSNQITKTYPVEILKARWELNQHYLNRLDKETRDIISVNQKMIDGYFSNKLLIAYARSGRYKLIHKDFKGARRDYRHAILFRGIKLPIWRLRALTGLVFSFLRTDVEGLSKFLGKVSYKPSKES
ncbi:MAG: glycosyltransferase family 2 protein [Bacteroidales bacterium]|jgi:glycosyltransferase involved in cell wall biosynthesis